MLFEKKFQSSMSLLREKNEKQLSLPKEAEDGKISNMEIDSKEKAVGILDDAEWKEQKEVTVEKYDRFAMVLSAYFVFIPIAVLILGIFALLAFFVSLL